MPTVTMPTRTVRDYLNSSLVWRDFMAQGGYVPGDIVVADPFKAGTTWVQRIVQQILSNGEDHEQALSDSSPWLDSSFGDHAKMLALLRQQCLAGERRVIKSHLPADAIPIDPDARYLFVGRNGKDLGLSFHNYLRQFSATTMERIQEIYAAWSGDVRPLVIPEDPNAFFAVWLTSNGYGCCDLFDVVRSWWRLQQEPNVLLVHYNQLNHDLRGQIQRIAAFLDVDPAGLRLDPILEHASFSYMRAHAEQMAPFAGAHMRDPKAFFSRGPARDHRAELSPEQCAHFDRLARERLDPECACWLESGQETLRMR
jgi:aryl sulfotransferase